MFMLVGGGPQQERVLHALRCLLTLRLLKVHRQVGGRLNWRIHSQTLRIKLGVANIALLILFCCHIAACGFYAIGAVFDGHGDSWVQHNLVGESVWVKYAVSLQWSLAQFTLGTTFVYAGSFAECAFSSVIVIVASLLLLVLLSRVIGAVIELEQNTAHGERQKVILMEYLLQSGAPDHLRSRIWATAAQRSAHISTKGRRMHEDEVAILACLPETLQAELRSVVYSSTLTMHPFFCELELVLGTSVSRHFRAARKFYMAFSELGLHAGRVLFSHGKNAENMYFVARGELSYCQAHGDTTCFQEVVKAGPWFSEVAIWMKWEHCGEMTALTHAELFSLDAHHFQELMLQELPDTEICWRYAKAFARYAQLHKSQLTDIYIDHVALKHLVSSVRREDHSARYLGVKSSSVT
jgi:CRP-like cAMP-binding protein